MARGCSQKFGIDYFETYAPVVRQESLRTVLAIAAAKKMKMIQGDVKTAFLNGDLQEEIYMTQPEGFEVPQDKGEPKLVWLLRKSIYGLKQAPRCWNERFHSYVVNLGLNQSTADRSIYYDPQNDLILVLYVDDCLIMCASSDAIESLKKHLQQEFEMTFGPPNQFIGMEIEKRGGEDTLKRYSKSLR